MRPWTAWILSRAIELLNFVGSIVPELDAKLGEHVVHQGLALAVAPLPQLPLEKVVDTSASRH